MMTTPQYCIHQKSEFCSQQHKVWNIPQLRKQSERLVLRQIKKTTKAENKYKTILEKQTDSNEEVSQQLEELITAQQRLELLTDLEADIRALGNNGIVDLELEERIVNIGVKDEEPEMKPRVKKVKKPKPPPRQPFKTYQSLDGTYILVGKTAVDNDILSLDTSLRDQNDWWLHAGGCAGSHVVIRWSGEYSAMDKATLSDAAALALKFSKGGNRGKVTITRCRNIFKPYGAAAGMVGISGDSKSIRVDLKTEKERLRRLEESLPQY